MIYLHEDKGWIIIGHISEAFDAYLEDIISLADLELLQQGQATIAMPVSVTLLYVDPQYGYDTAPEDSWIVTYADNSVARNGGETAQDIIINYSYYRTFHHGLTWQPDNWILTASGDVLKLVAE